MNFYWFLIYFTTFSMIYLNYEHSWYISVHQLKQILLGSIKHIPLMALLHDIISKYVLVLSWTKFEFLMSLFHFHIQSLPRNKREYSSTVKFQAFSFFLVVHCKYLKFTFIYEPSMLWFNLQRSLIFFS